MQVILDSSFARLGSAPIWGGKEGEFRDWTKSVQNVLAKSCFPCQIYIQTKKLCWARKGLSTSLSVFPVKSRKLRDDNRPETNVNYSLQWKVDLR